MKNKIYLLVILTLLSGCAGVQLISHSVKTLIPWGDDDTANAKYKVGDPYVIMGKKYYPKEDLEYDEKGIASWYGGGDDNFHGKRTANGEIYNTRAMTAAHKTLPMPCFVRVTNLENGRRIILRVNDRGPYVDGRIIDVSQKGAELLGFANKGTAKVRVQILAEESKKLADAAKNGYDISEIKYPKDTRKIKLEKLPESEIVDIVSVIPSNIYVQAGSFSVSSNAYAIKEKIATLGTVNIEEAVVNGTNYYRVQVGPIANVSDADTMMSMLKELGIDSIITIK